MQFDTIISIYVKTRFKTNPKPLDKCFFGLKQDSKESSPRSLNEMLLKLQVNSQNVQNTQWSKFFKFSKSSKFLKCSKFKSCQITILKYSYDTKWCNHINSCHSKDFKLVLNPYDVIWYKNINFCQTWRNSTTCLDIFW